MPTVFLFAGCPADGLLVLAPYSLSDQGVATELGPFVATYTHTGMHDSIVVPGTNGDLVDIEYDETNSLDQAPFLYRATVTIHPSLLTTNDTFVVRMLNPAMPSLNDLGAWNSYVLVACP
jgi:hypothetical protein